MQISVDTVILNGNGFIEKRLGLACVMILLGHFSRFHQMVSQNIFVRSFFKPGNFLPDGKGIFPVFQPFVNPFDFLERSDVVGFLLGDLKKCLERTVQKTSLLVVFSQIEESPDFDLFINVGDVR